MWGCENVQIPLCVCVCVCVCVWMVIRVCVSYTNTLIDSKFTEGCAQGQVAKRECRTDLNFFFKEETRQSWGGSCCCSVARLCLTFCDPLDCSIPDLPVLHYLLEFPQIHAHWLSDAIQSSHPQLPPSPFAINLSQHQCLFQRVGSSHQVTKVLELQLQSFQWIFRVDFL